MGKFSCQADILEQVLRIIPSQILGQKNYLTESRCSANAIAVKSLRWVDFDAHTFKSTRKTRGGSFLPNFIKIKSLAHDCNILFTSLLGTDFLII